MKDELWLHPELPGKYEPKMLMASCECQDTSEAGFLKSVIKLDARVSALRGSPKHAQLLKE